MNRLALMAVWFGALVIDGSVFPALLGSPAGFGTIVFLVALALSFGVHRWVIGWGIAAAFLAELFLGAYFGTLIGAWLVIVWIWHGLNRFMSLKPSTESDSWLSLVPLGVFGMVLFIAGTISEWAIIYLAYERGLTFSIVQDMLRSPAVLLTVCAELIVLLVVMRGIYKPKVSFYG